MGDIDSLINSLDSRIAEYTNPAARGICGRCKRDIHGKMIESMQNTWHEECWKCEGCSKLIGTDDFYAHDGRPYCHSCEQTRFLPACDKCNKPIEGVFTEAFDKKYHPEHFCCAKCDKHLPDGTYYPNNGRPYCAECSQ